MDFYDRHKDERDRFEIIAFHDGTAKTFEDLDQKTKDGQEKVWKKPLPLDMASTILPCASTAPIG